MSLLLAVPALPVSAQQGPGAVTLSQVSGRILVDGRPYAGGALHRGDVVMAIGTATATLAFPDGCQVGVTAGAPVSIGAVSPCAVGTNRLTPGLNVFVVAGRVVAAGAGIGIVVATQGRRASP